VKKGDFFDITPVVSSRLGVFPGDTAFERHVTMDTSRGDHLGLSWIRTTLHLGAHADAPNHYSTSKAGIAERSLEPYLGAARVLHTRPLGASERISFRHLLPPYNNPDFSLQDRRVLVRTSSFPDPERWNSDFAGFDPALLSHWAKSGVILVGIDTPSVDLENDRQLVSHQVLARSGMAVLEGLDLKEVPEGVYTLVALPLRLEAADASPVRAVLYKGEKLPWV
jgi:arylformamidase